MGRTSSACLLPLDVVVLSTNVNQFTNLLASSLVSTGGSVVFVSGVSANSSVTPMKVAGARGDVQVADSFPGR